MTRTTKAQREQQLRYAWGMKLVRRRALLTMPARNRPYWWQQQYDLNEQSIRWHEQQLGIQR